MLKSFLKFFVGLPKARNIRALAASEGGTDWLAETKARKAGFFMERKDAERYHRGVYENLGHVKVKNVIEVEHVVNNAYGAVLDVGTGTGRFAIPMHDAGMRVTATDISPQMIEVAKEAAGERQIDWYVADAENLPFENGTFDTVTSINVIHHLPQWKSCVREFKRVLKPGGRIIFDLCSGEQIKAVNKAGPKYGYASKKDALSDFFAEVEVSEVEEFAQSESLSLEKIVPHDFFNSNYFLQELLSVDYESFIEEVKNMLLKSEDVFEFWCDVERLVICKLPPEFLWEYLIVLRDEVNSSCPREFPLRIEEFSEIKSPEQLLKMIFERYPLNKIEKFQKYSNSEDVKGFVAFLAEALLGVDGGMAARASIVELLFRKDL